MLSTSSATSPAVQRLLALAIHETESLDKGEEFLLSDLFKGYKWKRIQVRDRLLLGSLFLSESKHSTVFSPSKKNRSNLQLYRKK